MVHGWELKRQALKTHLKAGIAAAGSGKEKLLFSQVLLAAKPRENFLIFLASESPESPASLAISVIS